MSDQDEIAKRVAAANAAKQGKSGKRQAINPRPNRVDSEFMDPMREAALQYWPQLMLALHAVTSRALAAAVDPSITEKERGEIMRNGSALNPLIRHMAQFGSGAVHPAGSNTVAEKELAAERVALARQKFAAKEAEALVELQRLIKKDE